MAPQALTCLARTGLAAQVLVEVVVPDEGGASPAKHQVLQRQERSVLRRLAEVVRGLAGDVRPFHPEARRLVQVGAEPRVEGRGNSLVRVRDDGAPRTRVPVALR